MKPRGEAETRCVVIGGSIAGLLAASALARHFQRVTVIERDTLPADAVPRAGVPQARHIHALLVRGRTMLERLLPGIIDELQEDGALLIDGAGELAWCSVVGWGARFPSQLLTLSCSRDRLEWGIRRRVTAIPEIKVLDRCEVSGLLTDGNGGAVTGVRLRREDRDEHTLSADLVVDASGRGARTPQWLKAMGYEAPEETVINANLGYASRFYRRPAGFQSDWKLLVCQSAPPHFTRGGLIAEVDGERWLVTLTGGDRDYPPTEEAAFLEFARSLPLPLIHDLIRTAAPLTPIAGYRATENRVRHYERLTRFPDGLLVLGDAACAFNPVYGQGMTVAGLGAELLDDLLAERGRAGNTLSGLGREFQRRLARQNRTPWLLATSSDYRYRTTSGEPPTWRTRLIHRYLDGITELSTRSVAARKAALEVYFLLAPPASLFRPELLARVLPSLMAPRRPPDNRLAGRGAEVPPCRAR